MRGDGNKDEVRLIQKSMKEAKMMHEGDSLFSSAETSSKLPLDKDFVENFMWAVCVCRGGGGGGSGGVEGGNSPFHSRRGKAKGGYGGLQIS